MSFKVETRHQFLDFASSYLEIDHVKKRFKSKKCDENDLGYIRKIYCILAAFDQDAVFQRDEERFYETNKKAFNEIEDKLGKFLKDPTKTKLKGISDIVKNLKTLSHKLSAYDPQFINNVVQSDAKVVYNRIKKKANEERDRRYLEKYRVEYQKSPGEICVGKDSCHHIIGVEVTTDLYRAMQALYFSPPEIQPDGSPAKYAPKENKYALTKDSTLTPLQKLMVEEIIPQAFKLISHQIIEGNAILKLVGRNIEEACSRASEWTRSMPETESLAIEIMERAVDSEVQNLVEALLQKMTSQREFYRCFQRSVSVFNLTAYKALIKKEGFQISEYFVDEFPSHGREVTEEELRFIMKPYKLNKEQFIEMFKTFIPISNVAELILDYYAEYYRGDFFLSFKVKKYWLA